MSKRKRIKSYNHFKKNGSVNEAVVQRDNTFLVGGIKVETKTLKSYIKKVKDETGTDLANMYSNSEIAEELVKWSVATQLDNIENVPVSALLGGDEEMSQDVVEDTDELTFDEEGEDDSDMDMDVDMPMGDEIEVEDADIEDSEDSVEEDEEELGDLDEFEDVEDVESEDVESEDEEDVEVESEDEDSEEEEDELPL